MKALLITALCCSVSLAANAQLRDRLVETPSQEVGLNADEMTRQMANRLRLNEAQFIRLKAANQIKLARLNEIRWQYQQDPTAREARLAELEAQYEQECRRILTPTQIGALQDEQTAKDVPASTEPDQNSLG
ncbi:hypothetical protein [Hymenobacter sp. B81]|uniref:hypothetical protein n=1 Tax=Hymenobacter sp. B81 TaxID=3344878 RepID=UPI0037DC4331